MNFKFTIIGAGMIGLAVARELSQRFKEDTDILIIDKERSFGRGVSGRNSEVIHSGIYYPSGSLKHRLCIQGRHLLYEYCERKKIPVSKCGKIIIAKNEQEIPALEELLNQARKNEVENVSWITGAEIKSLEPDVHAVAGIFSTETGIINTHEFMRSLESEINKNNGNLLYGFEVVSLSYDHNDYTVKLNDGTSFQTEYLINAAGLDALKISNYLSVNPVEYFPCKGTYFQYLGKISCNHLIYPVPHKNLAGLGVHATIDLGGRLRFGPDTEYIDSYDDFSVDDHKKEQFFISAREIFPNLISEKIVPDMAGIRPKIQGPNDKEVKDFYIKEESECGYKNFINLLGIESPGLTGSLAIADYISTLIVSKKSV